MSGEVNVRDATTADGAACADVYAPYVRDTVISFESEPPSPVEMADRIAAYADRHAFLVAERGGRVVGFAYGSPHRERAAYRWSCDVSVYVATDARASGVGRALYAALLPRLAARGYQSVFAGATLPNDASVALHRAVGFEPVGTYRRVGYKFGGWHDVLWMQRDLGAHPADPPEPH